MIDIHAHIIPGVDDGPKDMETALALIQQALGGGVTQIVATPHFNKPNFDNFSTISQFEALKSAVAAAGLPVTLHLGNEVFAEEHTLDDLEAGHVYTIAQTKYVLLELPSTRIYPVHNDLVFKLQRKGYKVILAHIDRFDYFKSKPEQLRDLIDRGCLGQLSADFVVNKPKEAKRWFESGYAHFVASDMHHPERRPNRLAAARTQIKRYLGEPWAHQLLIENPTAVLHNREVLRMPTKDLKRSWLQGIIG